MYDTKDNAERLAGATKKGAGDDVRPLPLAMLDTNRSLRSQVLAACLENTNGWRFSQVTDALPLSSSNETLKLGVETGHETPDARPVRAGEMHAWRGFLVGRNIRF